MNAAHKQGVNPKKILVVKPSSLGDVVHSLPFLNALRSRFPRAEIHWVIARGLEGLLEGHPMISKVIIINKDMWKKASKAGRTLDEVARLFMALRAERYDIVVDLQGLLRSGIITLMSGAPMRVGFAEAREGSRFFYTKQVRGGKNIHAVERYLKVAEYLGCSTDEVIFPFPLMKNDLKKVREIKSAVKDYAVIVPGARWDTKIWPAESFGELASLLPMQSVVIGSGADAGIAERVVAASGGRAFSLAGKTTLRELIAVMKDARLVISNDSGPMHIAAGFHVPVAAIFGPTSPVLTGPYGREHIVVRSDEECSPCFRRKCRVRKCMKRISPAAVYEHIRKSLP